MFQTLLLLCISYITIVSGSTKTSYYKICSLNGIPNANLAYDNTKNFKISNNTKLVEGRICPCAPKYYCLINDGSNVCGISYDNDVTCFYTSNNIAFVKNAWPVIILWYGALLIYFAVTPSGKHIQNFLLSKLFKNYNAAISNQILSNEMQLRNQLREAALLQQRRIYDEVVNQELILKIKKFDGSTPCTSAESTPNSSPFKVIDVEDEVSCTICMNGIDYGDRIGALSCNHTFHVECLKQWLKRRNVCPLCLAPNIAASRPSSSRRVLVVNPGLPMDLNPPIPPSIPRASNMRRNGLDGIRRDLFNFDIVQNSSRLNGNRNNNDQV